MDEDQQKPSIIDIRKFFGGKSLSSANVKVNRSQVLKTQPSFIAAPELASLLDVVANSVEDKNNFAEKIKSDERVKTVEIAQESQDNARMRRALDDLTIDVRRIKMSYDNIIETLENDRKLRAKEIRQREDYIKSQSGEVSKERVGESMMLTPRIQPKESFTGQETSTAKDTGDFSVGKLLAAGAGLGLISVGSVLGEPAQAEVTSAGMYDVPKLTQLARQGGIPEKNIPQMVAIAMAESGGDPNAHNDDASTGDDSYGLWQINMIDLPNYKLGEERRKKFGIKSNEELKKPEVNVKAAKMILQGSGLSAWTTYQGERYNQYIDAAKSTFETQKKTAAPDNTQAKVVNPQGQQISSTENTVSPESIKASASELMPPMIIPVTTPTQNKTASNPSKELREGMQLFASNNPDNLYTVSSLRELNIV